MRQDKHHIMFDRQSWSIRPEAKTLRETPSLIPLIDRDIHDELHKQCPVVPLLGYHALRRILNDFYPTRDPLRTMDDLMLAMNNAAEHPKSHPLESDLARLAIQAVELQRPYIIEGIYRQPQ